MVFNGSEKRAHTHTPARANIDTHTLIIVVDVVVIYQLNCKHIK